MMYASFQLQIEFGGAAMSGPEDVADALEQVRGKIQQGHTEGSVMDVNGNTVGEWAFKTKDEDDNASEEKRTAYRER
jgi:hypothetical protein